MKEANAIPPAVSHKNHCMAADEIVEIYENWVPGCDRGALLRYTELVIRRTAAEFAKGALRGVEQMGELLCDPNYYATRKASRARSAKRQAEYDAAQKAEWLERQLAPTAEQIKRDKAELEGYIARAENDLQRWKERVQWLEKLAKNPKHIRLVRRPE